MKFPNIHNLVPQGEHFDESGIVNEGGFLTVSHLGAIESYLAKNNNELAQLQQGLEAGNTTITALTAERDTAQTSLQTANNTIAENNARIAQLEAQVKELGEKESGSGSTITTTADEKLKETNQRKASLLDPNHPVNQMADRMTAKFKKD